MKLAKSKVDETFNDLFHKRIMFLSKLEEKHVQVVDHIVEHHRQVKKKIYKNERSKDFQGRSSPIVG